jgi:hypothetical protein
MTRRRSTLAALLLCVLCLCAFGAANASAATLYVCQEVAAGTGKWEDSKCEKAKEKGNFGTVAPVPGFATSINGTATTTTTIGIFTPVHQDIQCTKLTTTGLTINKVAGELMENVGEKISFKFAGCTFKKEGCKVKGGEFEFTNLKSNTFVSGSETRVNFSPSAGSVLGLIPIEGCLESPITVEGSMIGLPSGSSLGFTEASSIEGKMRWGGFSLRLTTTVRLETSAGKPVMFE